VTGLPSRRPDRAGKQALSRYRDGTRAARLHTLVRWWSAPFPAIEDALPPQGRILEIGCGHGLFSTYAALAQPGRTVHGVDIDPDKIRDAQASVRAGDGRLSFGLAASGEVPAGPWDGVVVVDVLYLLPEVEQRRLLEQALATLAPGGVLVVKEMALEPAWKARWNTTQETLAVKLLGITEGHDFTFVPPARIAEWLTAKGATVRERRVDRGRLHPHHLLVAQVP
jgi:2-polyprenyl-3-methyl-5-hydroxy-6-metoxy-1,4-benzoquinol methylase